MNIGDITKHADDSYWMIQMLLLARVAHQGQTRRDGVTPYFEGHVLPVAKMVSDRLKPIALGHDLEENTIVTVKNLITLGFPKYITDAIDLLTHKNHEPNVSYWGRIAENPDAAEVKIADIKHNLSDSPSPEQILKYEKALLLFKTAGYRV